MTNTVPMDNQKYQEGKSLFLEKLERSKNSGVRVEIANEETGMPERQLSILQLMDEVKGDTKIGRHFVENWVQAQETVARYSAKRNGAGEGRGI